MGMTDKSLCDSCTNIGCEFQSGIVRTKCAFYMPPQLEPDNCGNYVVQDSTTKNDLEVDCISRQQAIDSFQDLLPNIGYNKKAITEILQEVPSVTPQLSSSLEKNSKKLEKDFGELDCISRADVNQEIEDYMDEQYHVLSDRTRERAFGAKTVMARINELPSVTPQPRKGHWIDKFGGVYRCSCCREVISIDTEIEFPNGITYKYCPNCGADMREVENE